jgi:hypothetical protein
MEEAISWIFIAAAVLILLFRYGWPVLENYVGPGLYWFFAVVCTGILAGLDGLFSAALLPRAPWILWAIWGGVLGGVLAFWTVAPVYGLRERRPHLLLAPVGLMLLLAGLRALVGA